MKDTTVARIWFGKSVRRRTWRKLAAMLRHGVILQNALSIMHERLEARKSPLARVFSSVLHQLQSGQSLDAALKGFVPEEEIMLIRGGHKSGRLEESLVLCSHLIEARQKIIGSVVSALAYPIVLFGLFLGVLLTLSLYVVPQLALISNPATWTGAAGILYRISSFVGSYAGAVTLAVVVSIILASLFSLSRWTGKYRLWVEKLPPWSFYRLIVGSVWLFTVATLMRSNLQLSNILQDMLQSESLSPWLRERVDAIRVEYSKGNNLGQVLADVKMHFPDDELVEDLVVYSPLPGFDERLHAVATEFLEEGITTIENQSRILNVVCIMAIVLQVGGLALSVSSFQQQIGSSMGGF